MIRQSPTLARRLATEFARAQGHRFADGQLMVELVEAPEVAAPTEPQQFTQGES